MEYLIKKFTGGGGLSKEEQAQAWLNEQAKQNYQLITMTTMQPYTIEMMGYHQLDDASLTIVVGRGAVN